MYDSMAVLLLAAKTPRAGKRRKHAGAKVVLESLKYVAEAQVPRF